MKFTMRVKNQGDADETAWVEPYNKEIDPPTQAGAEKWAADTVERFNATLRQNEKPREIVSVEVTDFTNDGVLVPHEWSKTNLVTLRGGYDTAKCEACGATARRYGVGEFAMDEKFERKGFHPYNCKPPKVRK